MSGSAAATYVLLSVALVVSLLTMVLYKIIKKHFFDKLEEELSLGVNVPLLLESPTSLKKIPAPSVFDPRATKSLSVVIPAYNETIRLPATLEETMTYLQRRRDKSGPNFTYEVIVVDDGSSDDTTGVAFEFVKKHGIDAVRVLSLPTNKGKGYAVKAGIMCTRGREVLFMDADGATAVSEIEKLERSMNSMLQEMKTGNGEARTPPSWERGSRRAPPGIVETTSGGEPLPPLFVLGSRAHLQNDAMAKRTAVRNVLMHGFHALVTLVVGNQIRDTQCGFKLMTRKAAQMIVPQQRLQRWAFDVELVKIAQTLQVPMKEEQVVWTEIPGSKVRLTSIAHIAFELALIKCGYDITKAWSVVDTGRITEQEKKKS